MKYLLVKGWLGFGDRLETLKMAVAFALKYNLAIHVDWRDSIWSHGSESFYTYFDLKMPKFNLDDIRDCKIYPEYWKDHLDEQLNLPLIHEKSSELNLNVLTDEKVSTCFKNYDCIVVSSIGIRNLFIESSFFTNVFRVIDQRIISGLNARGDLSDYVGVHIRGSDRQRPNKRVHSIQSLVIHAQMYGILNNKILAVSDDSESLRFWKNYHPKTVTWDTQSLKLNNTTGNHNLTADKLSVSKDQMNVEMLIDFFTLAKCKQVFRTFKDSRFSAEAQRLHATVHNVFKN